MKALRLLPALLASCVLLAVAVTRSHAVLIPSWQGDDLDHDVTIANNWSSPVAEGDSVEFGDSEIGSYMPYIPQSGVSLTNIDFIGSARNQYTFSGDSETHSQLLLGGNVTLQSAGDVLFGETVEVVLTPGSHQVSVYNGTTLTVAGNVSEAGPVASVVKSGNGTLVLSGDNTFNGGVSVTGGTLRLGSSAILSGETTTSSPVGFLNLKLYNGTALGVTSGSSIWLNNGIDLDCSGGTITIDLGCTDSLNLAGNISGNAGLTQNGGTLVLSGTNTFYGDTKVQNGATLLIGNDSSAEWISEGSYWDIASSPVGTGTLKLDAGSTLGVYNGGSYELHNDIGLCFTGTVTIDTGCGDLSLLGYIYGSSSLAKYGDGSLTLSGNNEFANGVTVYEGTLVLGSSSYAPEGVSYGPVGKGTLKMEAGTTLGLFDSSCYDLHNDIDLGCFEGTVTIDTGCGDLTLHGYISGTAGITKTGSGTLTLENENEMDGDFYVSAGTVNVNDDYALGYGALEFGESEGSTVNFNTQYPEIYGLEGSSSSDTIHLNGDEGGPAHLSIYQDEAATFAGVIAGSGSVYLEGCSSLTLSGQSTFTGGFTIGEGGKLILGSSTTMDGSTILSGPVGTGVLKMDDGATLSALGLGVHLANAIDLSCSGSVNFAAEDCSSLWLDGSLTGSYDINKTGAGTVYINYDNTTTFFGGTHVQAGVLVANVSGALGSAGAIDLSGGTLVANATGSLGSGTITFNGGALKIGPGVTLANPLNLTAGGKLTGNYTFTTPQTFGTGVTLAPGNSPGTMSFTAGYAPTAGLTLEIEINAATDNPGVSSDLIAVSGGDLDLSAGSYTLKAISLDIANSPGAVDGLSTSAPTSWTVITSANALTTFAGQFTIDDSSFVNEGSFVLTQSGNNLLLTFTPVPEPSTYALMALGAGLTGLAAWRKRRRA